MSKQPSFIEETLKKAGKIVLNGFQKTQFITIKGDQSNVVTQVDLDSERFITQAIKNQFPQDSIIAEESGFLKKSSQTVWVVDPIDGTSNYASGNPWFAIMIAKLENWFPTAAGIYLPAINELYYAEKNKGAELNGQKTHVSTEKELKNVLVSYGIDFSPDKQKTKYELKIIKLLVQEARNLRASGCSGLDGAYVASGKFGVCLTQSSKIWDNAPLGLIVSEAGGRYTDIDGKSVNFLSNQNDYSRNFTYLAAPPQLHRQLLNKLQNL